MPKRGEVGSLSGTPEEEDLGRELEEAARGLESALEGIRRAQRGGPIDLKAAREALDLAERRLRHAREKLARAGGAFSQPESRQESDE